MERLLLGHTYFGWSKRDLALWAAFDYAHDVLFAVLAFTLLGENPDRADHLSDRMSSRV